MEAVIRLDAMDRRDKSLRGKDEMNRASFGMLVMAGAARQPSLMDPIQQGIAEALAGRWAITPYPELRAKGLPDGGYGTLYLGATTDRVMPVGRQWEACLAVNVINALPAREGMTVTAWGEAAILWVLQRAPATVATLSGVTGISRPGNLFQALLRQGLVHPVGGIRGTGWEEGTSHSGRAHRIYDLTDAGREAVGKIGTVDEPIKHRRYVNVDEREYPPQAVPGIVTTLAAGLVAATSFERD
jgi:hypothetical protein